MKRIGEPVVLRRIWWNGPEPVSGDTLRTRTGRRYLILEVEGKRLDCVVIAPDHVSAEGSLEFNWTWGQRR